MSEFPNLQILTDGGDDDTDEAYVPGGPVSVPPPSLTSSDWHLVADTLIDSASRESSALAKSRAQTVAGLLLSSQGRADEALVQLRDAANTSPRLCVSALLFSKHTRDSGSAQRVKLSGEVIRAWTGVARHSPRPGSQRFAHRMLLSEYVRLDQKDEEEELLDRLVRGGDGDLALCLERVATRLAEGKSLSGMSHPPKLAADIHATTELIARRSSAEASEERHEVDNLKQDLAVVRASVELRSGDVAGCIASLENSGLPGDVLLEFAAALYGAAPGGLSDRVRLLWKLARSKNERRIWRTLLTAALLAKDRVSVRSILQQVDPGSGTLLLKERLLLSAYAGQSSHSSRDELHSLFTHDPITALALSSPTTPLLSTHHASLDAILVQLGAAVAILRKSSTDQAGEAEENRLIAQSELEQRGGSPLLAAALQLARTDARNQPALFADALRTLSRPAKSDLVELVVAAIFHGAGANELAQTAYESCDQDVSSSPVSSACRTGARRGLLSLQARNNTEDTRRRPGSSSPDPLQLTTLSSLIDELEGALLLNDPGTRSQRLNEILLASYRNTAREDGTPLSASLFAASCFAAQHGHFELAKVTRKVLSEGTSTASRICRLREIWETLEVDGDAEGSSLADSSDIALRALAPWLSVPQMGTKAHILTRIERLRIFAAAILGRHLKRAATELDALTSGELPDGSILLSDRLLQQLRLDISELEVALLGDDASTISSTYFGTMAHAADSSESQRRFALERLAELDERRDDKEGALLFRRALSEEFPNDVGSQVRLEELQRNLGQSSTVTAHRLSQILPPGDRDTYAHVLGLAALVQSDLRATRKILEPALDGSEPSLSMLRALIVVAREKRDDQLLAHCYAHLARRSGSKLDRVSINHELSLIHARAGDHVAARRHLDAALELSPRAFPLHHLKNYLEKPDSAAEKAEQLYAFAQSCAAPAHRVPLLVDAAEHFMQDQQLDAAATCYDEVLMIDGRDKPAHLRLVAIYKQTNNAIKLRATYEHRLQLVDRKTVEQLELELALSKLLLTIDESEVAKSHLELLLSDHPENLEALHLHSALSFKLGDVHSAEKSLVVLRRLSSDGSQQLRILHELGKIYFEHTGQLERAMDVYQAALSLDPNDEQTSVRLVDVYCRLGLAERAAQLQTQLIQNATLAETKRELALRLAEIYERIGRDPERASATLERTRKAWPLDAHVLSASIEFMDRRGDAGARAITLNRVEKEARRRLEANLLDHTLLDTLTAVAQLSGREAEAEACRAARGAYLGELDAEIRPAGLHCLASRIDAVLSPHSYPEALRRLLQKTGDAMDAAFSVDLNALGARPLLDGALHERVQKIAEAIGWPRIELFESDSLGARCLPVSRKPPRLLIGAGLQTLSGRARDFLILRALKLQIMGVGALSRSREEDRFPEIAALLHLFSPNWRPPAVDLHKVAKARALIEQGLSRTGYDDDVPTLALEAIGSLGGQSEGLIDAPRILANRACLVGVGDLGAVFEAMAAADGKQLTSTGPSRFRFIDSHKEAKELLLFMTSAHFTKARVMLGLVTEPEQRITMSNAPQVAELTHAAQLGQPAATFSRAPQPPPRPKR